MLAHNLLRKYMKYFIAKINDVKFNMEHNNVNSIQRSSRDCARDFFRYSPVNNALSPLSR